MNTRETHIFIHKYVYPKTTNRNQHQIDGKTGFIVPTGNSIILAEKIINLLNNKCLMREMGKAGYIRLTEKFNWDKAIEKINFNLRSIITSG